MRKAIVLIALAISACEYGAEKDARDAVSRDIRDPSSAQFRDVKIYDNYICGEVNGKNGMGAYAGFARFWYDIETKQYRIDPQIREDDDLARTTQRGFEGELQVMCK